MRSVFTIASCCIAALFLFSVVTPEPCCHPACQSTAGVLTVVDDYDFTLCSGFTFVSEGHHRTECLYLPEQACFTPSPFISTTACRAPPSCFGTAS